MSGERDKAAPAEDFAVLAIPGARGRVEAVGTRGIFYKIRQGGEILVKRKRAWPIQMKNGSVQQLKSSGWLPGFQSLYIENDRIYRFGAEVGIAPRILSFLPLGIIAVQPFIGGIIGLALTFCSIYAIKNPQFPPWAKIVLPIMNALAGLLITIVILGSGSGTTGS